MLYSCTIMATVGVKGLKYTSHHYTAKRNSGVRKHYLRIKVKLDTYSLRI